MGNGVLNNTANAHAADADATIAISRAAFNRIILKQQTVEEAKDNGEMEITGDIAKVEEVKMGYIDKFEFWFNIVEP